MVNDLRAGYDSPAMIVRTARRRPNRGSSGASPSTHERIHSAVAGIPRGRVATYGQIARLAGLPGQARMVGWALGALPEGTRIPWHRVVNAEGRISTRSSDSGHESLQEILLRKEGVRFSPSGAISLPEFEWRPRRSRK